MIKLNGAHDNVNIFYFSAIAILRRMALMRDSIAYSEMMQ
jgi:hypothetical protein